jgi:hypothetical protein
MEKKFCYLVTDVQRKKIEIKTHLDELYAPEQRPFINAKRVVYVEEMEDNSIDSRYKELTQMARIELEKLINRKNPLWNKLQIG